MKLKAIFLKLETKTYKESNEINKKIVNGYGNGGFTHCPSVALSCTICYEINLNIMQKRKKKLLIVVRNSENNGRIISKDEMRIKWKFLSHLFDSPLKEFIGSLLI